MMTKYFSFCFWTKTTPQCFLLLAVLLSIVVFSLPAFAEEEQDTPLSDSNAMPKGAKQEMTREEIDASIGMMGDVDEIPEGFEFSQSEKLLWLSDHLANITKPAQLYYEFSKSGSLEEGFDDSVYLSIYKLNDDGTKMARLDFFTGSRKQQIDPDNVNNIVGNPVLGIYMQGDVFEMDRLTGGSWRHFQKRIKIALREIATVETIKINFSGKQIDAQKISFRPYLNDPYRSRFQNLAEKYYEVVLSPEIPGTIYQIKTVVMADNEEKSPLMEETLRLVSTKPLNETIQ